MHTRRMVDFFISLAALQKGVYQPPGLPVACVALRPWSAAFILEL